MVFFLKQRLVLFLFCILFFTGTLVYAEDTCLKNMTISNTRDNLLLYFELENSFTEKILRAVESGVKISFSFPVRIYKQRRLWPDKKIIDLRLSHTIKYDALKKEYFVTRSWKSEKSVTLKTFKEAKAAMNHVDGLNIMLVKTLVRGDVYRAKAKAELDKLSLPYYLKYLLFFLSFWEFETNWCSIDFEY